jgi:CHAT domain-containing protein
MAMKILVLTANPDKKAILRSDREMREIQKRLEAFGATNYELIYRPATEAQNLIRYLQTIEADIVHFAGHGSREELYFEDASGKVKPVPTKVLEEVFADIKKKPRCVVLNSCVSNSQAEAIAKHVECVIGMREAVKDNAAIAFAAGFYEGLALGLNVAAAFRVARQQMAIEDEESLKIPRLRTRAGLRGGGNLGLN